MVIRFDKARYRNKNDKRTHFVTKDWFEDGNTPDWFMPSIDYGVTAGGLLAPKKINADGEQTVNIINEIPEGSQIIGKVKLNDGTNGLVIDSNGNLGIVPMDSSGAELFTDSNPGSVIRIGSTVAEQLDDGDADASDVLTFSEEIESIEIYHNETTQQEFEVNGLTLKIASGGWRSPIGGTPSADVTIPADITCTVVRLV